MLLRVGPKTSLAIATFDPLKEGSSPLLHAVSLLFMLDASFLVLQGNPVPETKLRNGRPTLGLPPQLKRPAHRQTKRLKKRGIFRQHSPERPGQFKLHPLARAGSVADVRLMHARQGGV